MVARFLISLVTISLSLTACNCASTSVQPDVAAGYTHSIALRRDNTAWVWGQNSYGQGNEEGVPRRLSAATNPVAVAAGYAHNIVLKSDGTVWTCGWNSGGQLGNGLVQTYGTSGPVNGLTGVVAVAGGFAHSLALKSDGSVWAWGDNSSGELGDGGAHTRSLTPIKVNALTDVVAIAAGFHHSVALKADGSIWTWGSNTYGQLGDGSAGSRSTPVQISGIGNVVAVSSVYSHVLVIKSDHTVWAWGDNSYGKLGDGTTTQRRVPVQITALTDVTSVKAGYSHSLALASDGTVWAWGSNSSGQCGDIEVSSSSAPVHVPGITSVISLAAGGSHSVAWKSDGTAIAWGSNGYGQLSDGTTSQRSLFGQVANLPSIERVVASGNSTFAIGGGSVWAWGNNTYGQLGIGNTTDQTRPIQVPGLLYSTNSVATGGKHSVALKNDGTVWAWGNNSNGQLGNGTLVSTTQPSMVPDMTDVAMVAAGDAHTVVLKWDGTVWMCGGLRQPPPAIGPYFTLPYLVTELTDVACIAASGATTYAVLYDGTVWTWQCDTHSPQGYSTPIQVVGLWNAETIAAAGGHTLAGGYYGPTWAWGSNTYGQVGNGTTTNVGSPVNIGYYYRMVAGDTHSAGINSDGNLCTWGCNDYGQLGIGTTTNASRPTVVNLPRVGGVAAGASHTVALKTDGTVWTCGRDISGELGDGRHNTSVSPVTVMGICTPLGSVLINNGAKYAISPIIALTLAADGTQNITEMRFSNDGSTWSAWEPYSTQKTWNLTAGIGWKTVSAMFRDAAGNLSAPVTASISRPTMCKMSTAVRNPDPSSIAGICFEDGVVTSVSSDYPGLWVESSDRSAGLKIDASWSCTAGTRVVAAGKVSWTDGVPYLRSPELISATSGTAIRPLGFSNLDLAYDLAEAHIYEALGPAGLLATGWGRVTYVDSAAHIFYIDDGSNLTDGMGPMDNQYVGMRVACASDYSLPLLGQYVRVTGIRSAEHTRLQHWAFVNGVPQPTGWTLYLPVILTRNAGDICAIMQ